MIKSIKLSAIYIFIILLSGCTMKYSFTGASISPDAKTVFVNKFPNMAPLVNPLLSNELTEALKNRFMSETNLAITNSKADLNFEGSITQYNTRPVAIQAGSDQAQMNRLTITVKVEFKNILEPKNDYKSSFTRYAEYESIESLESVENALVSDIIDELVDDIFNKAVINW